MAKAQDNGSVRFTKEYVDTLEPDSDRETFIWEKGDGAIKGFGIRIMPSGIASYLIQYRNSHGRTCRLKIGRIGVMTPARARELAREKLSLVSEGQDPSADRHKLRHDLTVSELIDVYRKEGPAAKPNKKASSWKADEILFERHIKPLLGRKIARSITSKDVAQFQADVAAGKTAFDSRVTKTETRKRGRVIVKGGKGIAARSLATLAATLQFGVGRNLLISNPAKGVPMYKANNRERFLSEVELTWLTDVLAEMDTEGGNRHITDSIRLLLLTGCRKEEILSLQWDFVAFDQKCLRLPDSKTGFKIVQLAAAAQEVLVNHPRVDKNPWVFPALKPGQSGHYTALQTAWDKIRKRATVAMIAKEKESAAGQLVQRLAREEFLPDYDECVAAAKLERWQFPVGMTNVRLHDLRHSFASFAVANGTSLFIIAKLLGHRQIRTTEKYAHLADDPIRAASDNTANKIETIMKRGRKELRVVAGDDGK